MSSFETSIGADESLPVTNHHDVYPAIDPTNAFKDKPYKGKVVLITGASEGIGATIALFYAKAGASLTIVARRQHVLEECKANILKEAPEARVLSFVADVKDWKLAEQAVEATIEEFGQLDILISNAGVVSPFGQSLLEKDPERWWNTFEINLRGTFNFIRASLAEIQKTQGYVVVVSTVLAQYRLPGASDYATSKFAVQRLVEYITVEFPTVKTVSLHPGVIQTNIGESAKVAEHEAEGTFARPLGPPPGMVFDTIELPAATLLYLTSGKADWLNGRYYSSSWDIGEVERDWKEKIVEQRGLVAKLHIPRW